ncbi:MAG: chromate transporter [Spirochaetales bacterium]|nr:chromate transporter [Spirochaetales bacterium]
MLSAKPPSPLRLFIFFARISAVTLGGGYVLVPVIARGLERKGWMDEKDFFSLFGAAQSLPGPIGLNAALFAGRALAGLPGLFASALGVLVPPFAAILLVSEVIGVVAAQKQARAFLDGAFAVVPGLVAALLWRMVKTREWNIPRIALALAAAVAMILAPVWAPAIFFAAAAVGWFVESPGMKA